MAAQPRKNQVREGFAGPSHSGAAPYPNNAVSPVARPGAKVAYLNAAGRREPVPRERALHPAGAERAGIIKTEQERLNDARAILDANPGTEFSVVTSDGEEGEALVRVLWRNGNTCELSIPHEKWDPFLLLQAAEDCEEPGRFAARMAEMRAEQPANTERQRMRG